MDGQQFDRLTQQLTQALSRRRFGATLAALGLGAGLGADPRVKAKKKKKKKRKPAGCANGTVTCGASCVDTQTNALHCGGCGSPCPSGQACDGGECQDGGCAGDRELCGTECVNLDNDEQNCGECGITCDGDLTCLSGACDCAEDTKCGTACVDLQTDDDHCGQCNRACDGDLTCINGDCGCAAGTKCGTDCVNIQTNNLHCGACGAPCNGGQCVGGQCVQPPECSSDFDCGAGAGDLTCRNGRCVCKTDGEGICYRYAGAAGLAGECNPCCPGGNGSCLRDYVCRDDLGTTFGGTPYPICHCPAGTVTCNFGDSFRCTAGIGTDHRRCGSNCRDCLSEFGYCSAGECDRGCNLGEICASSATRPCGVNGLPCNSDSICCNMGPGTFPRCIPNVSGSCYPN